MKNISAPQNADEKIAIYPKGNSGTFKKQNHQNAPRNA
jgi:hypothetical protein